MIVVRINRLGAAAQTIHVDLKAGQNSGQDLRRLQWLENVKLDCIRDVLEKWTLLLFANQ